MITTYCKDDASIKTKLYSFGQLMVTLRALPILDCHFNSCILVRTELVEVSKDVQTIARCVASLYDQLSKCFMHLSRNVHQSNDDVANMQRCC